MTSKAGLLLERADFKPDSSLPFLPPRHPLKIPVRQYPLDGAVPVVHPGDSVEAGTPLTRAIGYFSQSAFAPASGTIESVDSRHITMRARIPVPVPPADPGDDDQYPHVEADRIRQHLENVHLREQGIPWHCLLSSDIIGRGRRIIISALDAAGLIKTGSQLVFSYPHLIRAGMDHLQTLFPEAEILLLADQEYRRPLQAGIKLPGKSVRWIRNRYPVHRRDQLVRQFDNEHHPGIIPETRGMTVLRIENLIRFAWSLLMQRNAPWRWLSVIDPERAEVRVYSYLFGTTPEDLAEQLQITGEYSLTDGVMLEDNPYQDPVGWIRNMPSAAEPVPEVCILCGLCVTVCPQKLAPFYLAGLSQQQETESALRSGLEQCDLCAACVLSCPAHINLVEQIAGGVWQHWGEA